MDEWFKYRGEIKSQQKPREIIERFAKIAVSCTN